VKLKLIGALAALSIVAAPALANDHSDNRSACLKMANNTGRYVAMHRQMGTPLEDVLAAFKGKPGTDKDGKVQQMFDDIIRKAYLAPRHPKNKEFVEAALTASSQFAYERCMDLLDFNK
jgi:hypothetical protein